MNRHIALLGFLYVGMSALGLLAAIIVFVAIAGGGLLGGLLSGEGGVVAITSTVGTLIALFLTVLSLPGLIAGWGLLSRRSWSRPLAFVLGALNLFNFPFGTALGIYTFWVLMNDEAAALLSEGRRV